MNRIITYIRQSLVDRYSVEEAKALSMLIWCDVLGLKAIDIYMGKDIILSESKQREMENIVCRLQKNEPIQYILGYAKFCGMSFCVAPGVLIPRPETAELVDLVVKENPSALHLLDIGTGSGCIAISLDKRLSEANVDAWDISEEALNIARFNNLKLEANVSFSQQDVFAGGYNGELLYDVIVSNPPYITEMEKEEMDANVLEWEPEVALFVPTNDPLRFYRRIADLGRKYLSPQGRVYFEINQAYGQKMIEMMIEKQYHDVRLIKDMFGKDRILTAKK